MDEKKMIEDYVKNTQSYIDRHPDCEWYYSLYHIFLGFRWGFEWIGPFPDYNSAATLVAVEYGWLDPEKKINVAFKAVPKPEVFVP